MKRIVSARGQVFFFAFIMTFMCASSLFTSYTNVNYENHISKVFNTLRTGDGDLRFYITTVQDG